MTVNNTKILFVGSVIPDESASRTLAFSRAGNMCQQLLLKGLKKIGVRLDKVLTVYPVPSYPVTKQFYFARCSVELCEEISLNILPFINLTPLKQLTLGLATFYEILKWRVFLHKGEQLVIFTFNISVPPGAFVLLAAKLIGAKVIAMIYDINVPGETVPRSPAWIIDYWLHKQFLPKYDGLVVISDAIAEDLAPNVPFLRIEGGIKSDLAEQYTNLNFQVEVDSNYFTIVAAGGLEEANGIREILGAFELMPGNRYRLLIAGIGPLETLVRDAAENDRRISYLGFISFNEVLKLYAMADVLVNMRITKRINTRYFFPSKIMEYLASGVPVISTCPGNMAEEYGAFAYLLHEETPESLAELILFVDRSPEVERRKKSFSARQYMLEHKTWDAQSRRIADFIDKI